MKRQSGIFLRVTWLSVAVVLYVFGIAFWGEQQMPEGALVPIHWNIEGKPDGYSSPKGFYLMPVTTLVLALILAVFPRFEARRENLLLSAKAYEATWAMLMLFMAGAQTAIVLAGLGEPVDVALVFEILLAMVFLVIGNYLGKVRSNTMFGIRTPWTLASEMAWNKTHRLGGRLMVLVSFLTLAVVAIWPQAHALALFTLIGGMLGMTLALMIYSRRVWARDPQRRDASWGKFLRGSLARSKRA